MFKHGILVIVVVTARKNFRYLEKSVILVIKTETAEIFNFVINHTYRYRWGTLLYSCNYLI
jgi:hypothetical protein